MLIKSLQAGHLSVIVNYLVIASLIIIFVFLAFLVLLHIKNPFTESLTPATQISNETDPDISTWTPYENAQFSISFDIPDTWHTQDYSSFYNNGGVFVAFSPQELPCATCSYLNNGYFSLRIYSQQTDPALYSIYLEKVKKVEQDPTYKKVPMDSKVGILNANTVSVESDGWIYDLSLDKNNGSASIETSTIMKHVLSSFKFTKLFNK
jgi:hypothetical protein